MEQLVKKLKIKENKEKGYVGGLNEDNEDN